MSEAKGYMDRILEVRYQSPEEEINLCRKLLKTDESEYSRAFAHTYLADAFHSMGMLEKAMDEYHQAMELIEKSKFDKLSLTLYNLAGIIYIELDDEQGALDCFFKEIEIADHMEDHMMCSAALANISYVYRSAGAYDKAEAMLDRAYKMSKATDKNDFNVAFSEEFYNMLRAGLAVEKGETEKALGYLEKLNRLKADSLDVPLLYASCYARQGKKDEALAGLAGIWNAVENIRNCFERLSHYFDILDVLMALREYEDAARFVQVMETLLEKMDSAGKWSSLMEYEIRIYTALGEKENLERAYELFFQYDVKFKEISKMAVIKRLKKRIELQEEAEKRASMEAWQNVLYKRSEYDELTGVLNRRGIRKYMKNAFEAARKQSRKFAILIVDVDFFKEFNDTYGHVAGDECLKKVAQILNQVLSTQGLVGRYGGDEFLLTVVGTQTFSVSEIAMEIKNALEEAGIPNTNSTVSEFVTVTIGGINTVPEKDQDFSHYLEAADKVLYSLKNSSRNGFVVNESIQGEKNG